MSAERYLQEQLNDYQLKLQTALRENERLRQQLTEMERRHKIALNNAYKDSYEAGLLDAWKRQQSKKDS